MKRFKLEVKKVVVLNVRTTTGPTESSATYHKEQKMEPIGSWYFDSRLQLEAFKVDLKCGMQCVNAGTGDPAIPFYVTTSEMPKPEFAPVLTENW